MDSFEKVCRLLRYYIIISTSEAGSGHLTSSLSAVELMAVLFYRYFRFDLDDPAYINNDRLILSKGHASPLFYSLYKVAGKLTEKEMLTFRKMGSVLEGHPTKRFPFTEVPTGSLGQGLSAGVGMALSAKMDGLNFMTFVLMGDGEIAEGQVWEAINIASRYKLNNLVGIIDVNRLGQNGETITGYDLKKIEERVKSFGWKTYLIGDGHNPDEIQKAFQFVLSEITKTDAPYMIIAKTVKGKGVGFLENLEGWHGRSLDEKQRLEALDGLGEIDKEIAVEVKRPGVVSDLLTSTTKQRIKSAAVNYQVGDMFATREAYGDALLALGSRYSNMVVMDCDVGNSTFSDKFKNKYPERFFEMFIAEQNMVSAAMGMSVRGKVPFVSTFAAFLERAYDQVRIANLSGAHIVLCGSHGGVSIGEDGPSQSGLEDLAYFRSLLNTTVFYPCDAVSTYEITKLSYPIDGLVYLRTTRPKTPVIYGEGEGFRIGGSKTLRESKNDAVTVITAGITVHEAIKVYDRLEKEGISVRIIDAYCIKPIDAKTILKASKETKAIITVEDHYITGGLGDAVLEALSEGRSVPVYKLGIEKVPQSGKPEELMQYEGISAEDITGKIKEIIKLNIQEGS